MVYIVLLIFWLLGDKKIKKVAVWVALGYTVMQICGLIFYLLTEY